MTQYTEFIKSWAQKHNKSYMCAATDPRAREEYHGAYPKRPTKSKLKQNREAAVMGLMDMGAKAKESAAAKAKEDEQKERQRSAASDLMSMGSKAKLETHQKRQQAVAKYLTALGSKKAAEQTAEQIRTDEYYAGEADRKLQRVLKKEADKVAAKLATKERAKAKTVAAKEAIKNKPAADLARAREALNNPAANVLTNPDLLRMIGSFTPKPNINKLTKTELLYLKMAMADIKITADGGGFNDNKGVDINGKLTVLDFIKNSELPKQGKGGELNFNKINEVLDMFMSPKFSAYVYHSGGMGNRESVKLAVKTTISRMPNVVEELKKSYDKYAAAGYDEAKVKENTERLRAIRNAAALEKRDTRTAATEAKGAVEPDIDKYTTESLVYAIRQANALFRDLSDENKQFSNGLSRYTGYADKTPAYIIGRLKNVFKYNEPDVPVKNTKFIDAILRMGKMTKKEIKNAPKTTLRGF